MTHNQATLAIFVNWIRIVRGRNVMRVYREVRIIFVQKFDGGTPMHG